MKVGIITFPGSNCDDDLWFALSRTMGLSVESLWHKDRPSLSGFDLIALPGGFSYGDYLRCGAMASVSPIVDEVKAFAAKGGKVIGICNGFQILCEMGLLPGALAKSKDLKFICDDVSLRVESTDSPWTCQMKRGDVLKLPIAHGDGRYVVSEEELGRLRDNGQILLTYTATAEVDEQEANPNGSVASIAGVCSANKNVFGLMPHPERATDLRSRDGLKLWQSLVAWHQKESR